MRVLHLFSNHKWTGPAEPALNLCLALRELGVEADFACAPGTEQQINKLVETARDRGIEPILKFRLRKHRHWWWNRLDSYSLIAYLREHPYDIIHCHLDNDHHIALQAATRLGTPLIRSCYNGDGFPNSRRHNLLLKNTSRIIAPSAFCAKHTVHSFGIPPDQCLHIPTAIDTVRFDPERMLPDGRRRWRIPSNAFVVGAVARMQPHRKFEVLLQAFKELTSHMPESHLVLIGRGTHQQKVVMQPVAALGMSDKVHCVGYLEGDDYVGMLRSLDAGVYLVPGTDGTCRAVRELMSMARPVIVSNTTSMLKELVTHDINGLHTELNKDALVSSMLRLGENRGLRHALGMAARTTAVTEFALPLQAKSIKALYSTILPAQERIGS